MARPGRLYIQLDCGWPDDDRVVELSDVAQLLDVRAMCLARRLLSDGRLTRRQLERIAPIGGDVGAMIGELEAVGLWTERDGGYVRRSWSEWNDSAADIAIMSKGGVEGNHLRWHVKRGLTNPDCPLCTSGDIGGESGGDVAPDRGANRREDQTRPDETRESLSGAVASVCSVDLTSLTPRARERFEKSVDELRSVGATAEDVIERAPIITANWRDGRLTPKALCEHWHEGTGQLIGLDFGDDLERSARQLDEQGALDRRAQWVSDHPGEPVPPASSFLEEAG